MMHQLVYSNINDPADTITFNVQWPDGYNMTPPSSIVLTDAATDTEKNYIYLRTTS